ncbi:MAG: MBL fold metallo-hydrolase [Desulfobacterales bacterium]|nr:MBL fold metallo-hydrolase [Desulfobacterales bacterium]
MRVDQPGPVTDRITLLGRNESCVYLVDGGEEFAILGGGMTYIVPDIITQIDFLGIDPGKIRHLVIHHSHFDHVGIVPGLKRRWPWLKVAASSRAKALLSRTDVVETIVSLNTMLLPEENSGELKKDLDIRTIGVDNTAGDNDTIRCGDLDLVIIEVPGHSSCSIAVYIPRESAMAASDAGGIPYGDHVFAAANSDFDAYQASLEKMSAYPARVHLSEHYGAVTGDEGSSYMERSIAEAVKMRALLEATYARHLDEEKTVEELIEKVAARASDYFLPKEVMTMVLGQMTRFIAKQHARQG